MTIEEFDNASLGANMKIQYHEQEYDVMGFDLEEKLFAINLPNMDEIHWVRCEHVTLTQNH